jgi:hypothetical protein
MSVLSVVPAITIGVMVSILVNLIIARNIEKSKKYPCKFSLVLSAFCCV